jgi:hypothetical protein
MSRRYLPMLTVALLLGACAGTPPPPGTQADEARLAGATVPGQATRASVLAALGPTRSIAFDSGYEVWLYQVPKGGGLFSEYVVLFDPKRVVHKTRQRAPAPVKQP